MKLNVEDEGVLLSVGDSFVLLSVDAVARGAVGPAMARAGLSSWLFSCWNALLSGIVVPVSPHNADVRQSLTGSLVTRLGGMEDATVFCRTWCFVIRCGLLLPISVVYYIFLTHFSTRFTCMENRISGYVL